MSEPFDLPHLLTDVIADVQPTADDKGVHVAAHNMAAMPQWVEGDEPALRRMLLNTLDLVVGAATGGTVILRFDTHESGDDRWICVIGWRGHGDDAIVEVKSAFIVTLRQTGATDNAGPFRMLVVDDSAQHRAMVTAYLIPTAHAVTEAQSGENAVERVHAGTYDVVLMDVQMPGIGGLEAIRQIREYEFAHQRPRSYIVALSAMGTDADATEAAFAGADDCLPKPLGRDELFRALSDVRVEPFLDQTLPEQPGFSPADTVGLKPDGSEEVPDYQSLTAPQLLAVARHQVGAILMGAPDTQVERLRVLGQQLKTAAGGVELGDIAQLAAALETTSAAGVLPEAQTAARTLQAWMLRSSPSRS